MKFDKEKLIKQRFWIILGVAIVFWLPIFFVALFGLSAEEFKKTYDESYKKVSGLKDFHNDKFTGKLEQKRGSLQGHEQLIWAEQAKMQKDEDAEQSRWKQGTEGLFWFDAMKTWQLPNDQDTEVKVKGENGVISEFKAGNMNAEINLAIRLNWYFGFYAPEVEEVQKYLAPAYADHDGKNVVVSSRFNKFKKDSEIPTSAEVWLMQEDLVVRREVLRLLQSTAEDACRFYPTGLLHHVPHAPNPHTYRGPNWQLELVVLEGPEKPAQPAKSDKKAVPTAGRTAPAAGSKSASAPAAAAGAGMRISPTSKLFNVRADQAPASFKDVRIRLSQAKEGLQPVIVLLSDAAKVLEYDPQTKKGIKFEDLGVKEPVLLKDFVPSLPIDATIVWDGPDAYPTDDSLKRFTMRDACWEVDLICKKQGSTWQVDPASRLTNVHAGRRKMPVFDLRLYLGDNSKDPKELQAKEYNIRLHGDAVVWGTSRTFKELGVKEPIRLDLDLDRPDLESVMTLVQQLSWDVAPVKKVLDIELGLQSPLTQGATFFPRTGTGAAAVPAASTKHSGGNAKAGAGGKGGTGGPQVDLTGVNAARYLVATPQLRDLPVALAVVIDQASMPQVLAALEPANSRLQFVTTTVSWHHVKGIGPEKKAVQHKPRQGSDSGSIVIPGGSGVIQPGGGPGGGPGGKFAGGGTRGGGGGTGAGTRKFDDPNKPKGSGSSSAGPTGGRPEKEKILEDSVGDPNMIMLVVHGVVKLYEPPPTKSAKNAPAGSASPQR